MIIPTNYGARAKLEKLTVMESAVVGVAGDEVFARWLAEVKNRTNSVRWRSSLGVTPARFRHGGEGARGGAW